jgi:hypothetical protein
LRARLSQPCIVPSHQLRHCGSGFEPLGRAETVTEGQRVRKRQSGPAYATLL